MTRKEVKVLKSGPRYVGGSPVLITIYNDSPSSFVLLSPVCYPRAWVAATLASGETAGRIETLWNTCQFMGDRQAAENYLQTSRATKRPLRPSFSCVQQRQHYSGHLASGIFFLRMPDSDLLGGDCRAVSLVDGKQDVRMVEEIQGRLTDRTPLVPAVKVR
ncbi:hypothetical protein E2C01_034192 [Portunus trituberculatus]|uniref:Uncharacterized protein n=1 Tax=Portunus trituberculatus TaxID=210409 RepID=A0A5B7F5Y6_PORTR|nr:hypothetical protein [Portunus trituberculatus]